MLSREALRRFVTVALEDDDLCRTADGEGAEDVELGKCLEAVNVRAGDSRDERGRGRFFPFVPEEHLMPKPVDPDYWYWKNLYYPSAQVSIKVD